MKTRRIPVITKQWLALVVVLALLSWVGISRAAASLQEQLVDAAKSGDLELVKTLLAKGADINAGDDDGFTALMAAVPAKVTWR
jgi:hypothetical protein